MEICYCFMAVEGVSKDLLPSTGLAKHSNFWATLLSSLLASSSLLIQFKKRQKKTREIEIWWLKGKKSNLKFFTIVNWLNKIVFLLCISVLVFAPLKTFRVFRALEFLRNRMNDFDSDHDRNSVNIEKQFKDETKHLILGMTTFLSRSSCSS